MNDTILFAVFFSGIWTLIGVVFLIIGIVMLKNAKKKRINCTSQTYGKVTDIVRRVSQDSDGSSSVSWHPVFEYNIGELKYVQESIYGAPRSKYARGQNVEIYYNPENYNKYYVAGDSHPRKLATIFTIVGIAAIIIAIFSAIFILKIGQIQWNS